MNWISFALISALFSTMAAIAQKKTLQNIPALQFSFLVSAWSLLFCIPLLFGMEYHTITWLNASVLFGKTILTALAFWQVMLSIQKLDISLALPLMVLTPGLVAVLGFLLLGETLLWYQFVGLVLLVLGTYILELELGGQNTLWSPFIRVWKSPYHHYIWIALALFTITSLLDSALLKKFKISPYSMTILQQVFSVIIFFIMLFFIQRHKKMEESKKVCTQAPTIRLVRNEVPKEEKLLLIVQQHWKWLALIGFFTFIYRYTQIEATKLAPAVALVLAMKRTSVFFSSMIGGKIFRESHLLQRMIAITIMIAGAILTMKE